MYNTRRYAATKVDAISTLRMATAETTKCNGWHALIIKDLRSRYIFFGCLNRECQLLELMNGSCDSISSLIAVRILYIYIYIHTLQMTTAATTGFAICNGLCVVVMIFFYVFTQRNRECSKASFTMT